MPEQQRTGTPTVTSSRGSQRVTGARVPDVCVYAKSIKRLNVTFFLTTDPVPLQYQHAGMMMTL